MDVKNKIKSCEIFSPSQNASNKGERRLWTHVLERALRDCCYGDHEARRWLMSDKYYTGSFLWICQHLRINYFQKIRFVSRRNNEEKLMRIVKQIKL